MQKLPFYTTLLVLSTICFSNPVSNLMGHWAGQGEIGNIESESIPCSNVSFELLQTETTVSLKNGMMECENSSKVQRFEWDKELRGTEIWEDGKKIGEIGKDFLKWTLALKNPRETSSPSESVEVKLESDGTLDYKAAFRDSEGNPFAYGYYKLKKASR